MLNVGVIVGERYEIAGRVGSGGMADVYKAKDHKLNRFVAMKVLKPEFSADTNFIKKFQREAQAAAGLAHPNIVNVFDVGEDQGINYIVMELVEGITLKEYISKKGKLTVKEATSIAIQVAMGLYDQNRGALCSNVLRVFVSVGHGAFDTNKKRVFIRFSGIKDYTPHFCVQASLYTYIFKVL